MELKEFEQFLMQYEKDIYSFCRYLTLDRDLADDLYQDTVLHAFESIDRIDVFQNPKAFFLSIAAGKWKNMWRKRKRRNEIAPTIFLDDFEQEIAAGDTPEKQLAKKALQAAIGSALATIDEKYKVPLILHYFDDFGVESIALICNIPPGTVKSRLSKGRSLLKELLKKEGFPYE